MLIDCTSNPCGHASLDSLCTTTHRLDDSTEVLLAKGRGVAVRGQPHSVGSNSEVWTSSLTPTTRNL